jgi:outer membrane lipoprotein-sorting protein
MVTPRLTLGAVFAGGIASACLLADASPTAQEDILARSRATYAALKSYADTGTVTHEHGVNGVSRHTFKTYYRAPRHFYFDFVEDKADGGSRTVIWCDGGDFQAWTSETGVHNAYPKGQGASAFISGTVFTLGANTQIPSLLFATTGLVSTLSELADMTPAGTETIGARPTRKLTGIARSTYGQTGHVSNVRRSTVWIDAETLLIRKIFEDTPKGTVAGARRRITTTFEPQANPSLDDSRFRFTPPAPGDRMQRP